MRVRAGTEPNRYQVRCDSGERPSTTVIIALAEITGKEETAIQPLSSAIDPDALDALFEHHTEDGESELSVSFELEGHEIAVRPGTIEFRERDERSQ
jgi:hypothetical protein